MTTSDTKVTRLLLRWGEGDQGALEVRSARLSGAAPDRAMLHGGRAGGHSLQATALLNEAYVRLVDGKAVEWRDRAHFLAVAARVMRHILVDHARSRQYQKRGGDAAHVTFDEGLAVTDEPLQDFVALDDALQALATFDERKSRVIEMRFFGGLTVEETATVLRRLDRYGDARLAAGEGLAAARDART